MSSRRVYALVLALHLFAPASLLPQASAVINPRFTPLDLVKGSTQVWVLRVGEPHAGAVAAEVVETLKGQPPAEKQLKLQLGGDVGAKDVTAALGGKKTAAAILFLYASRRAGRADSDTPQGALEIETQWFAVFRRDGKLVLGKDKRSFPDIWGGSARTLAAATRYAQNDPAPEFPVRSVTSWGESLALGKLAAPASGCLVADLGKPAGPCAVVLSEGGDLAYRAASKGGRPTDVTTQLKLSTASRAAAVGDFDGDGRIDLISWDGRSLELAAQTASGAFAPPKECGRLDECLSLDCIDLGGPRPGLVAGTGRGPVLLAWDAGGSLRPQTLAADADKDSVAGQSPGGLCAVADFNADGRPDVMSLASKGMLFFAGEGPGKFAPAKRIALPLVDRPLAAICGDFDADGLLDLVVAGDGGLVLLSRESPDRWSNVTYVTGELAYHGNAHRPRITDCVPCDVNTDGRQGMAMFYADRRPLLFFSRGFACFGWARELDCGAGVPPAGKNAGETPAPQADLKHGQTTGVVVDLNGDGIPDMLAVGAKGREVWAVFGRREQNQSRRTCTLALPPSARGPLTVTVRDEDRVHGMYVVRPGMPVPVGRSEAGPLTLGWIGPDGKAASREVALIDDGSRFVLP